MSTGIAMGTTINEYDCFVRNSYIADLFLRIQERMLETTGRSKICERVRVLALFIILGPKFSSTAAVRTPLELIDQSETVYLSFGTAGVMSDGQLQAQLPGHEVLQA